MENIQKEKHKSNQLIVYEAEQHSESVAKVPKFEKGIKALKLINEEVEKLQILQEADTTGITTDKHNVLNLLHEAMINISGALQSNADEKNNNALYEKVSISNSGISNLNHDDVIKFATMLWEEISKLTPEEVANEGLNADDISGLKKLTEEFKISNPAKKQADIERSIYTENLRLLFIKSDNIRKRTLDKLINQFKTKDADFYLKYQAAKNINYRKGKKVDSNGDDTAVDPETLKK
jgi:hypothetical protein